MLCSDSNRTLTLQPTTPQGRCIIVTYKSEVFVDQTADLQNSLINIVSDCFANNCYKSKIYGFCHTTERSTATPDPCSTQSDTQYDDGGGSDDGQNSTCTLQVIQSLPQLQIILRCPNTMCTIRWNFSSNVDFGLNCTGNRIQLPLVTTNNLKPHAICVVSYSNCNRTYNLCHVSDLTMPTTNETDSNTSGSTIPTTTVDPKNDSMPMIGDLTTKSEVDISKGAQCQECPSPACEYEINESLSLQSTQKIREVSDSVAA